MVEALSGRVENVDFTFSSFFSSYFYFLGFIFLFFPVSLPGKKMKDYRNLLLDLDGTITDPMEGITRSVEYALNHLGIAVNDRRELCSFIGPPLKDSFREFYNLDEEQAEEAVCKYRERYSEIGIYENELYKGMEDFLCETRQCGKKLFVATSKPTEFAGRILDYFHLSPYFIFIGGSGLDGSRSTKAEVIRYVLDENHITDLSSVIMIGDRKHDIIGARTVGIDSIGVLYGYGSYEELSETGAGKIVKDIPELKEVLCPF